MIISISNQKGGVGKTTTTQSLASGLSSRGFKVLSIDLDPQSNLSTALGADTSLLSIYEVMKGTAQISDIIQKTNSGDIAPSNILLAAAEIEFFQMMKREELLKSALTSINANYDFILIDTPPALGVLTINAFTASDRLVIPMGADVFSLQGIGQLSNTINQVKKYCNPNFIVEGILLTKYNPRTILGRDLKNVVSNVAMQLNTKVYDTFIRSSISIQEAQTQGANILEYAPSATAQVDYQKFVDEFLEELKK